MQRETARLALLLLVATEGKNVERVLNERARNAGGPIRRAAWQILEDVARNAQRDPVRFVNNAERAYDTAAKRKRRRLAE